MTLDQLEAALNAASSAFTQAVSASKRSKSKKNIATYIAAKEAHSAALVAYWDARNAADRADRSAQAAAIWSVRRAKAARQLTLFAMPTPVGYQMTWTSPFTGTGTITLNADPAKNEEGFEPAWTKEEVLELQQRWEYGNGWVSAVSPVWSV